MYHTLSENIKMFFSIIIICFLSGCSENKHKKRLVELISENKSKNRLVELTKEVKQQNNSDSKEIPWDNFISYPNDDVSNEIIIYGKFMKPYTGKAHYKEVGSASCSGEFLDGKASGKILFSWPNGNKNYRATFLSNEKHGLETFWQENGDITSQINYKYGLRDGLAKQWSNNNLVYSGTYIRGKKNGKHTVWYSNGKLWEILIWDNDILISSTEYYENGDLK
jgi:antitoxin component YwqK of YwqJK toxin-antitoxin module